MPLSLSRLLTRLSAGLVILSAVAATSPSSAQSLDEMAGQMILVGFQGDSVSDASIIELRDEIAAGGIGGVMYLKTNVASLKAVKAMNAAFLAASPGLPPFIALDQEGGLVERLTKDVGFPETPSAADVAAANSPAGARQVYGKMADGIAANGFNLNFGPVADLNVNKSNPVIAKYGRSFSDKVSAVVDYDLAFITAHHAADVLTAIKHFPGHGSSTGDTHEGFVDVTGTWKQAELDVFRDLVETSQIDMVMSAHIYNADYDPDGSGVPASLSRVWIEDVLRGELGYQGVVITDDLEMGAVLKHYPLEDRIKRAVLAGADILLFSNTARPRQSIGADIRKILVAAAEADPAVRARIEQSYKRIVALKQRLKN